MNRELEKAFTEQARQLFGLCSIYIDGNSPEEKESLLEQMRGLIDGIELQGLFEEITANLEEPMTDQQRERYCFSLITPFEAYSNALYPRVLIDKSQESLKRLQGLDGTDKLESIFESQIKDANERANKYFGLGFGADGLLTSDEAKSIFFELAQIITGYGNLIDAAFVLYCLDLKQLQERCGVWIKQFVGGEAEKDMRAMQIKDYIGSLTLAEEYISRLEPQEATEIELQPSTRQEPQQAEQGQQTGKRGRPVKNFRDIIIGSEEDAEQRLKKIKYVAQRKTGQDFCLVIVAAKYLEWITRTPTYGEVIKEFGEDVCGKSNYNAYTDSRMHKQEDIQKTANVIKNAKIEE